MAHKMLKNQLKSGFGQMGHIMVGLCMKLCKYLCMYDCTTHYPWIHLTSSYTIAPNATNSTLHANTDSAAVCISCALLSKYYWATVTSCSWLKSIRGKYSSRAVNLMYI